jgi:IS4 transposase
LDDRLEKQGIQLIAPHKSNRKKPATQDGRTLRRYKRRWKVERLFAWLQNFRRIQVRHDRSFNNYLAFVLLGCMIIFLRNHFEMTSSLYIPFLCLTLLISCCKLAE